MSISLTWLKPGGFPRTGAHRSGGSTKADVSISLTCLKPGGIPRFARNDRGGMTGAPPPSHTTASRICSVIGMLRRHPDLSAAMLEGRRWVGRTTPGAPPSWRQDLALEGCVPIPHHGQQDAGAHRSGRNPCHAEEAKADVSISLTWLKPGGFLGSTLFRSK